MAATPSIVSVDEVASRQHQHFQWRIDPSRTYEHPFDPSEISVDAKFTQRGALPITVPAFWDGSSFVVRFAPPTSGAYSVEAVIHDKDGIRSTRGKAFTVGPATSQGFVRRASNNRYFQFDDGGSFFPVGLNLCWPAHPAEAEWYDRAFATLRANGGNYARVWMARPGVPVEGIDQPLNQFDLKNAMFFDDVLAAAETHGISIMLTLMNYREFIDRDMWGAADWPHHPYNAARGGPATRPVDFFTDPRARRLFKARLRYLEARYSSYRSLAFWELFNEQENLPFQVPTAWNAEMAAYLRQIDPVQHLITTSARPPAEVWRLPEIDLTQSHVYGDGTYSDAIATIARSERSHELYDKPHLIGEAGIDFHGGDAPFDPTGKGTALHNSLWASLATGCAGTTMYWWWDSYIEPKRQWREFEAISKVASSIDWSRRDYRPIDIDQVWHDDTTGRAADLTILPTGDWGDTNHEPISVLPNGRLQLSPARYLYGPHHLDLSTPLTLELTLPETCEMRLTIGKVSDMAVIRASIDDQPVRDWLFSALPGAADTHKPEVNPQHGQYVADVTDPVELPVPAGHHRITFQVTGGDWVSLSKIVFTHAVEPKYANLRAYAVQDRGTKDTLLWLWDTRSNWKDDQTGDPPVNAAVKLTVPGVMAGTFDCRWIDTRSGKMIRRDDVTTNVDHLELQAPAFVRDLALHVALH